LLRCRKQKRCPFHPQNCRDVFACRCILSPPTRDVVPCSCILPYTLMFCSLLISCDFGCSVRGWPALNWPFGYLCHCRLYALQQDRQKPAKLPYAYVQSPSLLSFCKHNPSLRNMHNVFLRHTICFWTDARSHQHRRWRLGLELRVSCESYTHTAPTATRALQKPAPYTTNQVYQRLLFSPNFS